MLGQPFRFRRLERAGTPSSTATSASWVHGPSKTRLLPGFLRTVRYNAGSNNTVADSAAAGDATPEGIVRCEFLENSRTHEPVFRCSMEYNGNNFLALGSSASAATQKFFCMIDWDAKHVGSKLGDVHHVFMTGWAGPRRSTRLIVPTLREKILEAIPTGSLCHMPRSDFQFDHAA